MGEGWGGEGGDYKTYFIISWDLRFVSVAVLLELLMPNNESVLDMGPKYGVLHPCLRLVSHPRVIWIRKYQDRHILNGCARILF